MFRVCIYFEDIRGDNILIMPTLCNDSISRGEKKRKIETISSNASSDEVFEYTGNGQVVPKDVVSVRFHSSVVDVDDNAFRDCTKLQEVEFNEGLKKIGQSAFEGCNSLQRVTLPSTQIAA